MITSHSKVTLDYHYIFVSRKIKLIEYERDKKFPLRMINTIAHLCFSRRMFNIQRLCISIPALYVIFLDSLLVAQLESRSVTSSIPNALTSASASAPTSLSSSSNGLDSRANGLNSRYLNPAGSSVVTPGVTSSQNNNGLQQQQVSIASNLQQSSNSNQQLQQQNNNLELNLQRLPMNATPMLSTTYSYNGNIGQYVPGDISASGVLFKPNSNNNLNLNMPYGQYNQIRPLSTIASLVSTPNSNQFTYVGQNGGLSNQWPNNNNLFTGSSNGNYNNFMRNNQRNNQNGNLFTRPNPYHHSMMNQLSHMNNLMRQPINSVNNHIITDAVTGADDYYQQLDQNQYSISSNNQQQSSFNNLDGNYANNVAQIDPFIGSSASNLVPTIQMPTPGFGGYLDNYKGNDQCISADNRHGTCYPASECMKRGGTPMGKCGGPSDLASSGSVCCSFELSCGQFAAERFVYFRNPNYPMSFDQSRMCRARIGKLDKGICQLRLDFIRFDLARPTNGNCSTDMFVITGQNENSVIPKICGLNDGQHYYVGVDESSMITLHMLMLGAHRRQFEILITQIPCRSDYAAPSHCLQYYMGTNGAIKSFNYDDDFNIYQQQHLVSGQQDGTPIIVDNYSLASINSGQFAPYSTNQLANSLVNAGQQQRNPFGSLQNPGWTQATNRFGATGYDISHQQQQTDWPVTGGGYPNDLDYSMCIRKESGFCSITYLLSRSDMGLTQPFAIGHQPLTGSTLDNFANFANNDTQQHQTVPSDDNLVSTECRDDYLLIGGVRLCSGNAASTGSGNSLRGQQQQQLHLQQQASFVNGTSSSLPLSSVGTQQQSLGAVWLANLREQQAILQQQLIRLQQQKHYSSTNQGNHTNISIVSANNNNSLPQTINSTDLDQQQQQLQAQLQSLMILQQQLVSQQQQQHYSDQQSGGVIITDDTSGPFILRFVSNMARNARGFHLEYRQNPCNK